MAARGWICTDESAKEMLSRVSAERSLMLLPPLHRVPLRLGNVVEIAGPSPSAKTQILIQTLRYRLQRARETHGVTAHFLMIDSIGAFYWVDRASTSLHLESNSRKRLSLQSISETVVEEIRKLLLVHPMLVLATKATILGDTYSTNEVKRTSMKLSSNDPSNLRTVTGGPQKLSYREFMPLVWQSFVTHRILVRAAGWCLRCFVKCICGDMK